MDLLGGSEMFIHGSPGLFTAFNQWMDCCAAGRDESSCVIGMNDPNRIGTNTNQDRRQDNNHGWFDLVYKCSRATHLKQAHSTEGLLDRLLSTKWGMEPSHPKAALVTIP